jgi:hypothetical protein
MKNGTVPLGSAPRGSQAGPTKVAQPTRPFGSWPRSRGLQSPSAPATSRADSGRPTERGRERSGQGASPCDGDSNLGHWTERCSPEGSGDDSASRWKGQPTGVADGWSPVVNFWP